VALQHNLAATQEALSADAFFAAWETGQVMTLEQAIAYASEDIHGVIPVLSVKPGEDGIGDLSIGE
jgi:hypothetical protein